MMQDGPEVQAMIRGGMKGQQSLAGMMPSGNNVGGSPPTEIDPAGYCFKQARSALMELANKLTDLKDPVMANKVAKMGIDVDDWALQRAKERAEDAAKDATGNAMAAVSGINAMGVPGGMN